MSGPTTTTTTMGVLLERSEVEKSLKALETVITVFYDYCQLSASIAATNRKLARALKDTTIIKATSQYPANTLSAAALIFDAAGEVDLKFSKTVEREYEASVNELKKWVKKLKKEDKSLDEYTMAANAKVKAAGIAYEKKAKRKDKDALEEHTRYTTLLSTLGSEMSSAKHQHALFVTSKHTNTLYSLSASLGRVAEAQWLRVCETVRRSSPSVGPLGEGKAYLEGNFLSQAPPDLPSDTNTDTINSLPPSNSSSAPLSPPSPSIPTSSTTPTTNLTFISPAPDIVRERGREREAARGTTIKVPSTETLEKIADELRNSLALPAGLTIITKDKVNGSQTSLVPISETAPVLTPRSSQSVQSLVPTLATEESISGVLTPKSHTNQTQEVEPSTATTPQLRAKEVEPPVQELPTPTPEIPAPTAAAELSAPSSPVKSLNSWKSNATPPLRVPTPPTAPKTHAEALERIAETFQNPAPSEPGSLPRVERPPSRPFQRVASPPTRGLPESVVSPPQPRRTDSLPLSQPLERLNTPPAQMPAPGGVFRERGERERPHSIAVANAIPYRDVQRPIPRSPPTQEQPLQPHEYDRAERTRSIDSTFTNTSGTGGVSGGGNHVANLRDRWKDRQYAMSPPPPQQPFRGETMRPPSRVAEMASRFNTNTTSDTASPPTSYPYLRGAAPPTAPRWSASSDNLPLRTPLHNRQSAIMDDYSPPPPHRRERERERVDWRAEELELEQKRVELEIQRHRLEAARRREGGLARDRDRDSPYGGMVEEQPVVMRDRDGRGMARPPPMPSSNVPRAYSRSPVFDSPPEPQPHTNPRHSAHFDDRDRDRDLDYPTPPPAQQRSSWYMNNDHPSHPHTPPQETTPPKERYNWLGRGLRKLSIPTLSDSRDGGRDRQQQAQAPVENRSRRSFEDRGDMYAGGRR